MRSPCALALVALLALGALAPAPVARADEPAPADVSVAREHFKTGAKLAEEGKWAEAITFYEKSLAIKRAPITLYSLGIANQALGRYVVAIESFRAFLVEPLVDATRPYEQPARQAISELEAKLAYVVVRAIGSAEVVVSIDGTDLPAASLGARRPIDPGRHALVARAPGFKESRREVEVVSGQELEVELSLEPSPEVVPPGPEPAPTPSAPPVAIVAPRAAPLPAPPSAGPTRAIQWALVGGGGGLFAVGLGVGIAGIVRASDAPSADGDEAAEALDLAIAGDVVGAVGLAALGAGAIWLIVDAVRGEPEPSSPVQMTSGGLQLRF